MGTLAESRKAVPTRSTANNGYLQGSKENLSISSSTSNSLTDMSRNGSLRTTISSPNITNTTTTSVARSSPMKIAISSTSRGTSSVLSPASPMKSRRATPSSNLSFMKPTTASATKKLTSNTNGTVPNGTTNGINSPALARKPNPSNGRLSTSTLTRPTRK